MTVSRKQCFSWARALQHILSDGGHQGEGLPSNLITLMNNVESDHPGLHFTSGDRAARSALPAVTHNEVVVPS